MKRALQNLIAILLIAPMLSVGADVLELRDGRKLNGKVVRQDPRNIYFRDTKGKTSTHPKSRVRRIRYGPVVDPAAEKRKREAERKRREALRKKREEARRKQQEAARKAAEARKKAAAARRREAERLVREKTERDARQKAAREKAERERKLAEKQAAERRAREAEERRIAAEKAREEETARRQREAEEKRQAREEAEFLKEIETATEPVGPANKPEPAVAARDAADQKEKSEKTPERKTTPPSGRWFVDAGLARGTYNPDLESRFQADQFLNAIFTAKGFGFDTGWENKGFLTVPLGVRYQKDRWSFGSRLLSTTIHPRYHSFLDSPGVVLGQFATSIREISVTEAEEFTRSQFDLSAEYEVHRTDPFSVYLEAGGRNIAYDARLNTRGLVLTGATLAQDTMGTTAFLKANGRELSQGTGKYSAEASGTLWGIRGRYRFGPRWEVDLGLRQYDLKGTQHLNQTTYKFIATESNITVPGVFSEDSGDARFDLDLREERGKLSVFGRQWDTRLAYLYDKRTRIYVNFTRLSSTVTDSEVQVLRFNLRQDADPYRIELGGDTVWWVDQRYAYPGSSHPEGLGAIVFGIEREL